MLRCVLLLSGFVVVVGTSVLSGSLLSLLLFALVLIRLATVCCCRCGVWFRALGFDVLFLGFCLVWVDLGFGLLHFVWLVI